MARNGGGAGTVDGGPGLRSSAQGGKSIAGNRSIVRRFSSDPQKDRSLDDQLAACKAVAKREGYATSPKTIFTDRAKSGASLFKRDGILHILAHESTPSTRSPAYSFFLGQRGSPVQLQTVSRRPLSSRLVQVAVQCRLSFCSRAIYIGWREAPLDRATGATCEATAQFLSRCVSRRLRKLLPVDGLAEHVSKSLAIEIKVHLPLD